MREDMFKVIVERPRRGWRSAPRNRNRLSGEDDLPVKIGMKRHVALTRSRTKWLNENLNPLRRYLGRQVGRPWNDVYSEISATLAPGHTVKEHVRQHIDDFVARKITVGCNGELIHVSGRLFGAQHIPWRQDYYVDPNDGILKDSAQLWKALNVDPRPWRKRKPEADPNIRRLDEMHELRCVDGVWYEIEFHAAPESQASVFDLVERTLVPACKRHAVAKRQLSGAELRAFGISNKQQC
jgi:hypothetical protein